MRRLITGKPQTTNFIEFERRCREIFNADIYTNDGPQVRELEERFSEQTKTHAIAVSNATVGLELLRIALIPEMSMVALPSFTFVATAHALLPTNFPLWADVGDNWNNPIFPAEGADAYCLTNLFGHLADIELYEGLCYRRRVPLILDNAHCAGMTHKGRSVFSYGTASVLSLHATKILHGFEGGIIFTRSEDLAKTLRRLRNFGFESTTVGSTTIGMPWNHSMGWGTNAKMSEVHAAMALSNLEKLPEMIEGRRQTYELYRANLPKGFFLQEAPEGSNYSYVPVICKSKEVRDMSAIELLNNGIVAKKYFDPPCHKLKPYVSLKDSLPVTEDLSGRVICLPSYGPSPVDIQRIAEILQNAYTRALTLKAVK